MRDAQCLLLEEGKPPSWVSRVSTELAGDQLHRADIEQILAHILPKDVHASVMSKPLSRFRLKFPDLGLVELTVTIEPQGVRLACVPVNEGGVSAPSSYPPAASEKSQEHQAAAVISSGAAAARSQPTKPSAYSATDHIQVLQRSPLEIDKLFRAQLAMKASDMHLSAGVMPMVRRDGEMVSMDGFAEPLSAADTERILWELMPDQNRDEFNRCHDTDFAYEFGDEARFRCNVFLDRKGIGGVFRVIPSKILTAEELGLSKEILKLCFLTKGLVLVTGPTGSGKSTTLCALVDYINRHRSDHIITIEDPIEFVHPNKKCLINQREVYNHTDSFKHALRAALREDPDIILVGEMRDLETISIALETAETGHLVFGTLHTSTAPSTVDRIIDQFPADRQAQIRVMLAESLKGVIAQTLCKKIGGGRVPALEVLMCDHAIANLIREGKTIQILSIMQTTKAKGNITLNESLLELVKKKIVEPKEAYVKAVDKTGIEGLLRREGFDVSFAGGPTGSGR